MNNPIKSLTRKEWGLWLGSLLVVIVSNMLTGDIDLLTLIAACVGITSLIFAAKGNVWAQILMIVFSILYGIISWRFRYWGEMITYLGMTMPMAIWSTITWIKNPAENGKEVAIQKLTLKHVEGLLFFGTITTVAFYLILRALNTPNIVFSTISITTSFLAASLTMLRTSYYALGYASNDIVLIILWSLASIENPVYIPVVVNFVIFFFNDMYGFISWKKREKQTTSSLLIKHD
nr:nicotinamide riboside transporter PnuC [uncultured Lachnoclostridium sp.]